jgi:hypothetical protein
MHDVSLAPWLLSLRGCSRGLLPFGFSFCQTHRQCKKRMSADTRVWP